MRIDPAALPRLGQGRIAEVFALNAERALKLAREPGPAAPFEREAAALRAAAAAGLPVPAVFEVVDVAGRPGIVMERVDGDDILGELSRRPWRLVSLAREFARLHAGLAAVEAPGLPAWRERVLDVLERSTRVPPRAREAARPLLEALPGGDRLVHADFHPGNVILSARGPVLIDFANAYRGDPAASHPRTLLLLKIGELPPGSGAADRLLAAAGRRLFATAYARQMPRSPELATAWRVAAIIERLGEGIPAERRPLLRALARALRRG
jgi:aminoglycoside phosphotransferase (APT) family kinase protein